jgi:hypothetical protein
MSDTIFTGKNILQAYFGCRKTKRRTINALRYELDLENNLSNLRTSLLNRTYYPSRSTCFVVTVPKPREIFAADFCDRITHHILINQFQKIWEKDIFIEDSYACRKGKGHHYAASRVSEFVKKYSFYGQFDISSFFSNINKSILYGIFTKVINAQPKPDYWKEEILWLTRIIIYNDPTKNYIYKGDQNLKALVPTGKSLFDQNADTGLPIGNLTSQFLANVYLNELDHFVKENLGCPAYGRYVDDFLVFSNSKNDILRWRNGIKQFLKDKLKLTLHPRKQQIQPTRHGIPFVGYFIKPWGITVRRNVVKMAKNKIYRFNQENNPKKMIQSLNSYFGHFGKAKSAHLRKHLIEKHLSPELKSKIVVVGNWRYLKLRK